MNEETGQDATPGGGGHGSDGGDGAPQKDDKPRGERSGRGRRRGGRRRGGQGRRDAARQGGDAPKAPPAPPAGLVGFLARAGLGSRRYCDEMVRAGRVTVNGEVVDFPRQKLEPDAVVAVDGDVVAMRPLRYVLLNKPRGVASTRSDPHADKVVVDAVPDGRTLFPVGRLDVQTTGLIILTNDGALAHRLMHPSYGVPKTYVVRVRGRVGKRALATLRTGIQLEDGMTAPAEARLLKQSAKTALVELTIHQGRKRQVRRMFTSLGLTVDELHRRRYGPLSDADLAVGSWRDLRDDELEALRRAAEHVDACVDDEPEEHGVTLAAEVPEPAAADSESVGSADEAPSGGDEDAAGDADAAGDVGDAGLADDAKGADPAEEMPAVPAEETPVEAAGEMPARDAAADQGASGDEPDDRRAQHPIGEPGDEPDAD